MPRNARHAPDGVICSYVERNPLRAGKVAASREWAWGNAGQDQLAADLRFSLIQKDSQKGDKPHLHWT